MRKIFNHESDDILLDPIVWAHVALAGLVLVVGINNVEPTTGEEPPLQPKIGCNGDTIAINGTLTTENPICNDGKITIHELKDFFSKHS